MISLNTLPKTYSFELSGKQYNARLGLSIPDFDYLANSSPQNDEMAKKAICHIIYNQVMAEDEGSDITEEHICQYFDTIYPVFFESIQHSIARMIIKDHEEGLLEIQEYTPFELISSIIQWYKKNSISKEFECLRKQQHDFLKSSDLQVKHMMDSMGLQSELEKYKVNVDTANSSKETAHISKDILDSIEESAKNSQKEAKINRRISITVLVFTIATAVVAVLTLFK